MNQKCLENYFMHFGVQEIEEMTGNKDYEFWQVLIVTTSNGHVNYG
jgi:hypothetical protein